jgi:hypothetical protein
LILCKDALLFEAEAIELQTCQPEFSIAIFPKPEHPLAVKGSVLPEQSDGIFARFQAEFPQPQVQVSAQQVQSAGPAAPVSIGAAGVAQPPEDDAFDTAEVWRVSIPTAPFAAAHELYLQVDFIGDIGRAYLGETLIADHFYHGRTWEIGLKRFVPQAMQTDLYLKFLPLRKDAPIYLPENAWPDFQGTDEIVRVDKISLAVEQVYHIKMHSP